MKSKSNVINENDQYELLFAFKNCNLQPFFEPDCVSEEDQEDIRSIVKEIKNIYIDKTYVECKENKHSDTFLNKNGWDQLKETLIDSDFSSKMNMKSCESLVDIFATMIKAYAYQELSKTHSNETLEHVQLVLKNTNRIQVEISKDTSNEWKTYPGKWQTWKDGLIDRFLDKNESVKTKNKKVNKKK